MLSWLGDPQITLLPFGLDHFDLVSQVDSSSVRMNRYYLSHWRILDLDELDIRIRASSCLFFYIPNVYICASQ